MGLFVSRNGMETGLKDDGQECPSHQKSRSRPEGREDEIEMGPAHCRNRNPGPVFWLWTVFCESAFPSFQV